MRQPKPLDHAHIHTEVSWTAERVAPNTWRSRSANAEVGVTGPCCRVGIATLRRDRLAGVGRIRNLIALMNQDREIRIRRYERTIGSIEVRLLQDRRGSSWIDGCGIGDRDGANLPRHRCPRESRVPSQ